MLVLLPLLVSLALRYTDLSEEHAVEIRSPSVELWQIEGSEEQWSTLSGAFRNSSQMQHVKAFTVCRSPLGPKSQKALLASLASAKQLEELHVDCVGLRRSGLPKRWTKGLQELRVLSMSQNKLDEDALITLSSQLRYCAKLESLTLHSNPVADSGLHALSALLAKLRKLRDLDLTNCGITGGCLPNLAKALRKSGCSIRTLSLRSNRLKGDFSEELEVLVSHLPPSTTCLDLRNNKGLGDSGIDAVFRGLRKRQRRFVKAGTKHEPLQLLLGGCSIGCRGTGIVAEALARSGARKTLVLGRLDLSDNRLEELKGKAPSKKEKLMLKAMSLTEKWSSTAMKKIEEVTKSVLETDENLPPALRQRAAFTGFLRPREAHATEPEDEANYASTGGLVALAEALQAGADVAELNLEGRVLSSRSLLAFVRGVYTQANEVNEGRFARVTKVILDEKDDEEARQLLLDASEMQKGGDSTDLASLFDRFDVCIARILEGPRQDSVESDEVNDASAMEEEEDDFFNRVSNEDWEGDWEDVLRKEEELDKERQAQFAMKLSNGGFDGTYDFALDEGIGGFEDFDDYEDEEDYDYDDEDEYDDEFE